MWAAWKGVEGLPAEEKPVLCKLMMKMTSPPLCHILVVRSESPHVAHKGVEDDAFLHPSGHGVSWGQQTLHGANRGIKKSLELCQGLGAP